MKEEIKNSNNKKVCRVSPSGGTGGGSTPPPPPAKILTNPPSLKICPSPLMSPST